MVLKAHAELHRIRRDRAALDELPTAQLAALLGNINRDPSKGEPFTTSSFCLFAERKQEAPFAPEVAAVALALRHEEKAPPLLLGVWPQVLESSKDGVEPPKIRALSSDDESVWILAPSWERRNIRGGLVLVRGRVSGPMSLRDIDRPLMRYCVELPERKGFGWIEADLLLMPARET